MSADQYNVGGDWVTATITPAGESEGGGFNVHLWFPPGRVDELTAARAIEAGSGAVTAVPCAPTQPGPQP